MCSSEDLDVAGLTLRTKAAPPLTATQASKAKATCPRRRPSPASNPCHACKACFGLQVHLPRGRELPTAHLQQSPRATGKSGASGQEAGESNLPTIRNVKAGNGASQSTPWQGMKITILRGHF